MKKIGLFAAAWLLLCVGVYSGLIWSKPKDPSIEDFIGWEVTYSGEISEDGEEFVTEFVPSFTTLPQAGYLHFICKDGSVTMYLVWSRVIKVQKIHGSTSDLTNKELECVSGNKELRIPGITIS